MQENIMQFITTAISYANGPPHIGHAFELIIADALTRFNKLKGEQVFFQTGMDEHGQKIEQTAKKHKQTPKELCDDVCILFKNLNSKLNIDCDSFIRTTEEQHKHMVYSIFNKCMENGDIYVDEYEGWYNEREETFVTEFDAKGMNYKDATTETPLVKMKEPSYFFRLSKYNDNIIEYLQKNPNFIKGQNDVLVRLKDKPLLDISISRTTINWGIPVPNSEGKHVFYVWFDALINYLTGCPMESWPPSIQVIGKDIVWFHAVIWIGMLMSAKLELPKQLLVHGFVNDENGKKMSKSVGNVVSIDELTSNYPSYAIRYYLLKDNVLNDISFSEKLLIKRHDSDLLSELGNLVHRIFSMCHKYCDSKIPSYHRVDHHRVQIFDIDAFSKKCVKHIDHFEFHLYVDELFEKIHDINTYVNDTKIWEIGKPIKEDDSLEKRRSKERPLNDISNIMRTLLESLFIIGHFIHPIMPDVADKIIIDFLGTEYRTFGELCWSNLQENMELVKTNTILFTIIDTDLFNKRKEQNGEKKIAKDAKNKLQKM